SFFDHSGFDWFEVRKSFELNISRLRFSRGGSTITQQLAKNLFLDGRKSVVRKLKEALLTVQLERLYSKNELLEMYLNVVQFGPDLFGIKAASAHYCNNHPSELDVLESSFLAYLLPNPVVYSKVYSKRQLTEFAESRIKDLVRRMGRFKKLTDNQVKQAQAM